MKLILREVELPLRHAFTTTHGTMTVQRNLLVELQQDGVSGFGEGAQSRAYPQYNITAMREALEAARGAIEKERFQSSRVKELHLTPPVSVQNLAGAMRVGPFQLIGDLMALGIFANTTHVLEEDAVMKLCEKHGWNFPGLTTSEPDALWERLRPLLAANPFAQCALDEAAHDLWGKLRGAPVWKLWGLELRDLPVSDYTIGLDSMEKMLAKMEEFAGWPIYKIKLGSDRDMEIVRELRKHTEAVFRIDANTAWTAEQTLAYAPELKTLGVEFLEQPLRADDWAGMERVYRECVLPVIADESCQGEASVERCAHCFHGINIKLTKAGGLTPGRRMARRARELGLRVMAGCMNESSVGISALAQLLPMLDAVDMDGSLLIARDIATGVRLEKGRPIFPEENGTGVSIFDGV